MLYQEQSVHFKIFLEIPVTHQVSLLPGLRVDREQVWAVPITYNTKETKPHIREMEVMERWMD